MGVVIKLPGVGAIFIPVTAVGGQVTSALLAEVGIGLLHALKGFAEASVFPWHSARQISSGVDPFADPSLRMLIGAHIPKTTNTFY